MSILDLIHHLFWGSVAIALVVLVVLPVASLALTVAITAMALQVGLVVAMVGYIVGIPWAIYRRIVDGRWPDGG